MDCCRIIVVSDIHIRIFKHNPRNKDIQLYLVAAAKEIVSKSPSAEYLLINGDITSKGEWQEYQVFIDFFVNEIKKLVPSIVVLAVPGNHDVNWKLATDLFDSWIRDSDGAYRARKELLLKEKDRMEQPFTYFTKFCNEVGANEQLPRHKLFGFHVDKKNQVVFIMCNSAWFSLGAYFDKMLSNTIARDNVFIKRIRALIFFKAFIKQVLDKKRNFVEYGGQLLGQDLMEELEGLEDLLDGYDGYTVITCLHHPPSWLNPKERYAESESIKQGMLFQRLLRRSNVLISSHEHRAIHVDSDILEQDVLHINTGCLIEGMGELNRVEELVNNRYTILTLLNRGEKFLKESRYKISIERQGGNIAVKGENTKTGLYELIRYGQHFDVLKPSILQESIIRQIREYWKDTGLEPVEKLIAEKVAFEITCNRTINGINYIEKHIYCRINGKYLEDLEWLNKILTMGFLELETARSNNIKMEVFIWGMMIDSEFQPRLYEKLQPVEWPTVASQLDLGVSLGISVGAVKYSGGESSHFLKNSFPARRSTLHDQSYARASFYFDRLKADLLESALSNKDLDSLTLGLKFVPYWALLRAREAAPEGPSN